MPQTLTGPALPLKTLVAEGTSQPRKMAEPRNPAIRRSLGEESTRERLHGGVELLETRPALLPGWGSLLETRLILRNLLGGFQQRGYTGV